MNIKNKLLAGILLACASGAHAQITFEGYDTSRNASSNTRTVSEYTGAAQDELMIVACVQEATTGTWTDPADFTEIDQGVDTAGTDTIWYLGYKIRGATAGNTMTFTSTGAASHIRCSLVGYSGIDTTTPFDVTWSEVSHYSKVENDHATTNPSITTVTNNALVVVWQFSQFNGSVTTDNPPASYTARDDSDSGRQKLRVADRSIAVAGAESPGAWDISPEDTNNDITMMTLALRPGTSSPPSFTVGPTVTATANGYIVGGTIDQSGTVYSVACLPSETAPNAAQIITSDCGSGADAEMSAFEVWSTTADTFPIAELGSYPRHDVYVVVNNANGSSSVSSFADQDRSANPGQAIIELTSISTTSPCDSDSYFDPDVAVGDVIEYDTSSDNAHTVSFQADCDFTVDSSGDATQDHFDLNYMDTSGSGDFTSGPPNWSVGDDRIWLNNTPPLCEDNPDSDIIVLDLNVAMTARDLLVEGNCFDTDGDALSFSVTTGTLPTGTALSGTGNKDWSGTPTVEDETGVTLTFTATDPPGDTNSYNRTVYVVGTWPMPTVDDGTEAQAVTDVVNAAPWRSENPFTVNYICRPPTAVAGDVLSQSPAAGTELAAFASIEIDVALELACAVIRRRRGR